MFKLIHNILSKYIIGFAAIAGLSIGWYIAGFFLSPLVSVVMPVYNREALVGRAIESILNQTHKGFELIIVDDGSTDQTSAIFKKYAVQDHRIKILTNNTNRGISYSRNLGNSVAKGKYIAIMDSDDVAYPNWLETMVNNVEENKDIHIFIPSRQRYSDKGNEQEGIKKSMIIIILYGANFLRLLLEMLGFYSEQILRKNII